MTWILNYNVQKAFDNVNCKKLETIFKYYINCSRLWGEVFKMVEAEILSSDLVFEIKGTFQGSILSSFLFNLYLNEFDKFVRKLLNTLPQPEEFKSEQTLEVKREI